MPKKRKGSPYWQITVNGTRQSSGTTDYRKAKELEDRLNAQHWEAERLGIRLSTWDQACYDWFKRNKGLRSIHMQRVYSEFWEKQFSGKALRNVSGDLIQE